MFKELKEKVTNEYEKAKVKIQSQALNLVNNGTISNLTNTIGENKFLADALPKTIGRSESSSTIASELAATTTQPSLDVHSNSKTLKTSNTDPCFSLVDLDDDNDNERQSPQQQLSSSDEPSTSKQSGLSPNENDSFKSKISNFVSNVSNFVPKSDIESEYESESSYRNLDNVTKNQLIDLCYRLKERGRKYRERWADVVKAYRDVVDERDKLKSVLTESQDKSIRRINELKEQCALEQEAKRHLEENLRLIIEEKEEMINVLQEKFELLQSTENKSDNSAESSAKIDELQSQLAKSNDTLKSYKEQVDAVLKENDSLMVIKEKYTNLEKEIKQLKMLKDSTASSFAEAKQKLHDELESRKIIIKELKDQLDRRTNELKQRNVEMKSKNENLKQLNDQLNELRKNFENEKIVQSEQSKASLDSIKNEYEIRIKSMIEDHQKQVASVWSENSKFEDMKELLNKHENNSKAIQIQLDNSNRQIRQLETEKESLVEELDSNRQAKQCLEEQIKNLELKLQELVQTYENRLISEKEMENEKSREIINDLNERLKQEQDSLIKFQTETAVEQKKLKNEIENYKNELESKQFSSTADIQQTEQMLNKLNEEIRKNSDKIVNLEKDILEKNTIIIGLEKTKCDLETELDKFQDTLADKDRLIKKVSEDLKKSEKALEVTKNVIQKVRTDGEMLTKTIDLLQVTNGKLSEEKSTLQNEINLLNEELIKFKNRLFDIFYQQYADGQFNDIASMDYDQFLLAIEGSFKALLDENEAFKKQSNELSEMLEQKSTELDSKLSSQVKQLTEQLEQLKIDRERLAVQVESLRFFETKYNNLLESSSNISNERDQLQNQLESFQNDLNRLKNELTSNQEKLAFKSAELENKEQDFKQMKHNFQEVQKQLAESVANVERLSLVEKNEKQQQEENYQTLQKKFEELSRELIDSNKQNAIYSEEIAKVKSNAKEIIESKQKLKDSIHKTESKLNNIKHEYQLSMDQNQKLQKNLQDLTVRLEKVQQEKKESEKIIQDLRKLIEQSEKETKAKIETLESQVMSNTSETAQKSDQMIMIREDLSRAEEKCSDLEKEIESRNICEQELRTEIIALEEKLKSNIKSEKELKEEMKINEKVNTNLKDQLHKLRSENGELRSEIESMKAKHDAAIEKLYNQIEIRESQLDESLMTANTQHNSTVQDFLKAKTEISRLNKQIEELLDAKRDLEHRLTAISDSNQNHLNKTLKKYENQIESLQTKLDQQKQEIAEKMDQFDNTESKLINEHKQMVLRMESEINEKTTALEEVHEYYQQRLKAKDNELKHLHEQFTSTDRNNYQINALQNSILQYHEENLRLKDLLSMSQENRTNNLNNDFGSRSRINSDLENCKLLGIHLPQPTEYEYLRNILFEFMMGREPMTLAKVIAAVMRFNNEQTEQIMRRQESLNIKTNNN